MIPLRRLPRLIGSGIFGIALFWSGLLVNNANGQKPPFPIGSTTQFSSVRIIENFVCRRVLNLGRVYIANKDWKEAVKVLQTVLDEKEDYPIASQGVMVYRSHRDIRAVALKEFTIKGDENRGFVAKPGMIVWKSMEMDRSLGYLLENNKTRPKAKQWIDAFNIVPGYTSFLYDNTLLGTLSTDQRYVYTINDLAVPPILNIFHPLARNNPQFNPQDLKPMLMGNELQAFGLLTGRFVFLTADMPQFKDSHFLGLPISIGGKLYVLNERVLDFNVNANSPSQVGEESELRLVCLDPSKIVNGIPHVVDIQVLGNIVQQDHFIQNPCRRVNTAHLGFGEGILVCPTNAGEVFGIDLMTRSLGVCPRIHRFTTYCYFNTCNPKLPRLTNRNKFLHPTESLYFMPFALLVIVCSYPETNP